MEQYAHPMDFFSALNDDWQGNWPAYLVAMSIILDHRFPAEGLGWAKKNYNSLDMPIHEFIRIRASNNPAHMSTNRVRFLAHEGIIDEAKFCIWRPCP